MVEMISNLATSSITNAILELFANAYDADATEVKFFYDEDKNKASIIDNGSGMTPENLQGFYRLGDSEKLDNPVSPKGGIRIGKFGVATVLLNYLAGSYSLKTKKDGLQTIIKEDFSEDLRQDKNIPYKVKKAKDKKSGTEIVLKN